MCTSKWNYLTKGKAKAHTAYALAATALETGKIVQETDEKATGFSAITQNGKPPPSITVDGGCNVSLAHTTACSC